MYPGSSAKSHYNNQHRMANHFRHDSMSSKNDHSDRRLRYLNDFNNSRNDNRTRKDNSSTKHR